MWATSPESLVLFAVKPNCLCDLTQCWSRMMSCAVHAVREVRGLNLVRWRSKPGVYARAKVGIARFATRLPTTNQVEPSSMSIGMCFARIVFHAVR
jgi:hypothetical protein